MKVLNKYNKSLQAIYDHVGFVQDYVFYPIDDCTKSVWFIDEDFEFVRYADDLKIINSDDDYYEDEIYKQRFYKKHVYRGEKLTMVFCDPHVDGMKYFRIFDNSKEIKRGKI